MPTDNAIRASDGDRERTVGILREAYALGRLTLAEFDERTTAAFTGRTWGDLRALTQDLPAGVGAVPAATGARPPAAGPAPAQGPRPSSLAGQRARLTPMLVIALFWLAVTVWARAGAALIPIVFLLLMAVQSAGKARCGPGGTRQRPHPGDSSQRPGGQA
jgi:uncharacterized protein DUF1707